MKQTIAIIGGGFTGTMLAKNLLPSDKYKKILLFNSGNPLVLGPAYSCSEETAILNVVTGKMSPFPTQPNAFLNWCHERYYPDLNLDILAGAYVPRKYFGEFLQEIWQETLSEDLEHKIQIINEKVIGLNQVDKGSVLHTETTSFSVDKVVLATGNERPGLPSFASSNLLQDARFQQNPWKTNFSSFDKNLPLLIIGNGLTMVDTVLSLREKGFKNQIYSISPNGFNILPHRNFNFSFPLEIDLSQGNVRLIELVRASNKAIKQLAKVGVTAEPVIDTIRPYVPEIWRNFSETEKKQFMSRLRHLWGVARHRIPFSNYDIILREQINGGLKIYAGSILDAQITDASISLKFLDKKTRSENHLEIGGIVVCTGPETKIVKSENELLKQLLSDGIITQDTLQLGIRTNTLNFKTVNSKNEENQHLFAIGGLLKGEIWESTAVPELRIQIERLANSLG